MRRTIWAAAAAVALPVTLGALPASAAPSGEPNPAGNGVTAMELICDGQSVTVLVPGENSSDNGGWSVGQIQTGGHLIPTSFKFSLVDLATGTAIWSGEQAKGGGNANHEQATVTCTQTEETGATLSQILSDPEAPPGIVLPAGTEDDPAGFQVTITAVSQP